MTKRNVGLQVMVIVSVMIIALLLINVNTVKAYSVDNIRIGNEVEEGLLYDKKIFGNEYLINVSIQKLINLFSNETQKLDALLQEDNYIYDNIYYKLPENVTNASVIYGSGGYLGEDTKDLEIVTIGDEQYAKCPIGIIRKVDNDYYLGFIACDGYGRYGKDTFSGIIEMKNNNETIEEVKFFVCTDENTPGATLQVKGNGITGIGAGATDVSGLTYSRSEIEQAEDCYLEFQSEVYVGNSVTIEPFGTFTYLTNNENSYYGHTYKLDVTDKTIFNKDYKGRILLPEYNLLHFYSLKFTGDLIENVEDVISNDETTGIKLSTDTSVVPANTQIVAEKIESGDTYNLVVEALGTDVTKFELYDINLVNGTATIQPNGKVKISIPIPNGYDTSKIAVYRVNENGTKVQYDFTIENGYIVFETDHFSNYVVAEGNTVTTEEGTDTTTETTEETSSTSDELDVTPKTGGEKTATIITSMLSVLSALGIGVIKLF